MVGSERPHAMTQISARNQDECSSVSNLITSKFFCHIREMNSIEPPGKYNKGHK